LSTTGTIKESLAIIFQNDFEEGIFVPPWTEYYVYPGQVFECTQIDDGISPHQGQYQAKMVINGSLISTSAYVYKDIPSSYTAINLRFYIYLLTYNAPTQPHETYLGTISHEGDLLAQIGLTEATGNLFLLAHHSQGNILDKSSMTLSPNMWHCIEIQRVQHPTEGEYRVWVDGIEVEDLAHTHLDTSTYSANRIYVGNYHGCAYHPPNFVVFYVDCVVVSTLYIGQG